MSAHPSHCLASAYLARLEAEGAAACISGQVCREFLAVLTRRRSRAAPFTTDEALAALLHDANVVATMRANGPRRLATFAVSDFARFGDESAVEALVS